MRPTRASFVQTVLIGVCALALPIAAVGRVGEKGAIEAATGAALQGDGARARSILLSTSAEALSSDDRRVRNCIIGRFAPHARDAASVELKSFAGSVLSVFRSYWHEALTRTERAAQAETKLLKALRKLLGQPDTASLDVVSASLEARLKKDGWWSLQGRTGRLRELMLWRSQETRQYSVTLPEGAFATDVVLLRDFASLGWGDYATCGKRGAGGWATADRLFAVVPRYSSLAGEEFRVTFLGHETQHFADLRRWPTLAPWKLEYRAKLTELAQVDTTRRRVLSKFFEDRQNDPASPHSYANLRVVQDVADRLGLSSEAELFDVGLGDLNEAASALLKEDTSRMYRQGSRIRPR